MTNPNIDTLNDVTKTLIDSCKGYEKASEIVDDKYSFSPELNRRRAARAQLVSEFQSHVRSLGGEPETEGGMMGTIHRSFSQFSSLFQDDQKAAFEAIEDGEEYLADTIEDKLKKDDLSRETRDLLLRASKSAKDGERYADMVEDALDD